MEYNPPFDMLVGPFKDELTKANRSIRMNSDKTTKTIQLTKDRILNILRCGLDVFEMKEPYPEADFFTYIFSNKALLVALQRPCSRNVDRILKYRAKHFITGKPVPFRNTSSKDSEVADQSQNSESIVTSHRQKHKWLSDNEIKQIVQMYNEGYSTYEIARRYKCHKNTVSRHLKKAGVIVSNKASTRDKLLIDNVLRMNAISMKAVDIGKELGISESTVRRIIRENDARLQI